MPDEDAVAGDAEAAPVACAIEVAAAPRAGRGIALGWDERDPMNVLEVPEEMKSLLEIEGSGLGVGFRRAGIDFTLSIHTHGRHLGHRGVESARLATRGIFR